MRIVLAVAGGAAIGGVLRLLVAQFVAGRFGAGAVVYATVFINVTGSFCIGVVLEYLRVRHDVNPLWRSFLATGILGGYTTFSTFSFEALTLFANGSAFGALAYVGASVLLGIGSAALGIATVRALVHS